MRSLTLAGLIFILCAGAPAWGEGAPDATCIEGLSGPAKNPYLNSAVKVETMAWEVGTRAQILGDLISQRKINRLLEQLDRLIQFIESNPQSDERDQVIDVMFKVQEIEHQVRRQEKDFGPWLGFTGLAAYLGRADQIVAGAGVEIDTPSFPSAQVFFEPGVVHFFARDPAYGTRVLMLLMKGFVVPFNKPGVKVLQDATVRDWQMMEVKTLGFPFGEYRTLLAYRKGQLRVFKVSTNHNRTDTGAREVLHEFLITHGL